MFETTLVTHRPAATFAYATEQGARQLAEDKDEAFELALDIRRARLQRIKPLASAEAAAVLPLAEPAPAAEPVFAEAPDLPDSHLAELDPALLTPADRLARWQRKLLDLSLRNNLLNFRAGKKSLKLEAPDPGALEDLLALGQSLKLVARPALMDGADPRSQAIHEGREHVDVRREHALDALKRNEVFVDVPPAELEPRLVELFRTARSTLQEGGSNTLYLAMGFLSWTREEARDGKTQQKYRAPLILVPVTLNRKSVRSGFSLVLHDDEPRFNPTLVEMLQQDFKLKLPVADGALSKDDAGLNISAIWKSVSLAVKDIKGWEVSEDIALAMFSFAKYLMWKDLAERSKQLRESPVVRHLIDSPRESFPPGVAFPDPRRLDREFVPQQTYCPLPADSSQLSAVMAAVRGKNFVLIGPPGTGKSQTISNLIAQCLAEGKRVLFVSEKIAALDVVYRRLREVGLGDFCLELHSSKARKLDVLQQLQKAWEARGEMDQDTWLAEAQRLKRLRDELNDYVAHLHSRHSNGLSIFDAIGAVVAGRDIAALALSWDGVETHDSNAMEVLRDVVDRVEVNARSLGHALLPTHPLAAIGQSQWSPGWQQGLMAAALKLIKIGYALEQASNDFIKAMALDAGQSLTPDAPLVLLHRRARQALAALATSLPNASGHDWRFCLKPDGAAVAARLKEAAACVLKHREITAAISPAWPPVVMIEAQRALQLLEQRQSLMAQLSQPWAPALRQTLNQGLALLAELHKTTAQLSVQYSEQVGQINIQLLQSQWAEASKAMWPMSWWGKRAVRQQLEAVLAAGGEPDVGQDVELLVKIRGLQSDIARLDVAPAALAVWLGLQTRPERLEAALKFQQALDAVKANKAWQDSGLDAVADGLCGEQLAKDYARLGLLRELNAELNTPDKLSPATTGGLWRGPTTSVALLAAALQFKLAAQQVMKVGTLAGAHAEVARGECGPAMAADLQLFTQRAVIETKLEEFGNLHSASTGLWKGLKTDLDVLRLALQFQIYATAALANLTSNPADRAAMRAAIDHLLGAGNEGLEPGRKIAWMAQAYKDRWDELAPLIDELALAGEFLPAAKAEFTEMGLHLLMERTNAITQAESRLNAWCAWRKVGAEAAALGLGPLVQAVESQAIPPGQARRAFEVAYKRWWLAAVVDQEPVIRNFVSAEHEKRIDDFKALDARYTGLTRGWVRARLCAGLPTQDSVSKNSEWGVLRHEISKKKQHLPLRVLMSKIPTALTQLTPCLLMSPLSIAQYLAADATAFDVVVFDEASQIPVWDAIGAMARGKQVVMVGDPKQLPPSNFFGRAEQETDEDDTLEADLESILDECMGANLPTMKLNWHYRSRHESLITFSNQRYYDSGLVTFPSPVTLDKALSFHHVQGVYEKGAARTNPAEAKALVADLVARLKSPGFRASKLTIGVVTFNAEQQSLIEDLLDEERRKDPAIEPYFSDSELEAVFVKNLESVQGDERDIMYFSITYGPNRAGVVSMNFGPMNRDGGERRLNVAITRARHELRVFSSLKAEHMDLARTQSRGVRDLKHFLDFAERGNRALAEASPGSVGGFASPYEAAIAAALASKGWQLQTQVGASAFRIDLAVVHPDASGIYLCGIECDGATYHRSATARDRDLLREQVLRGLGWEVLRVWSTDWWLDPVGTLDKLDAKLQGLLVASRVKRAAEVEKTADVVVAIGAASSPVSSGT
ncbi:MAG: DUF4011 domain-containing protein [Pseudomonadota bacterium]